MNSSSKERSFEAVLISDAREALLSGDLARAMSLSEGLTSPEGFRIQGVVHALRGDRRRAALFLRRATRGRCPATWLADLANVYLHAKRWNRAIPLLQRILRESPDHGRARIWLAEAMLETGKPEECVRACDGLRAAPPNDASLCLRAARALKRAGDSSGALEFAELAADRGAAPASVHPLLSELYSDLRRAFDALHHARESVRLRPDDARACALLGVAEANRGDTRAAAAALERALQLRPGWHELHSTLIQVLTHDGQQDGRTLVEASRSWATLHAPAAVRRRNRRKPADPERRLRVGYVSGEFAAHLPSFHTLLPLISAHDRSRFEVVCYNTRARQDWGTEQFCAHSSEWRDAAAWDDRKLERTVRQDRIDVLVDCSAYFDNNRLRVFARRPAPVLVTYPNAPMTTGLNVFDAILTDRWATPAGCEDEYSEPVVRLPPGYIVWQPPPAAVFCPAAPFTTNGFITFGVFQRATKINEDYWDRVAEIIASVKHSRILVHQAVPELDDRTSAASHQILGALSTRGVAQDRVELVGQRDSVGHFATIARADIALDTFPYNGHATTCSCLWMGIPVVTLSGKSHASRIGASLLHRSGHPQWVAASPREFVAAAVRCADAIPAASADIRATTHARFAQSSVCDALAVTRAVEDAFLRLWRRR